MTLSPSAPWFISVNKMLSYTAFIVFIIYLFTSGTTAIGALLTSFFIFIIALLMVLVLTINYIQTISNANSAMQTIGALFKQATPILLILAFIGYLLWLVFTYKPVIVSGHVAPSYNVFMNLSVLLILAQMYILMQSQTPRGYVALTSLTSSTLYLLDVLLFICVNIIHSTLRYFTTDGFANYRR
jgi:hypothetical protein